MGGGVGGGGGETNMNECRAWKIHCDMEACILIVPPVISISDLRHDWVCSHVLHLPVTGPLIICNCALLNSVVLGNEIL